ncbi:CCA tRNA nucleotidyltransferase [Thermogutta sp.]|uniref:CCA tRNA nucleotidyltransferase n=1 Tax=Thermogutta sp. TaxID=1962930 RepID=UPI00321FF775
MPSELDPKKQREFAVRVVKQLREAGFVAYWAGGCVRDQLLGRTPKDYDVVTNALPEQVRKIFGHRRTFAVGAAFGVITVNGPKGAGQIEVATFRSDLGYSDGRHPDRVVFSSPQEDALRRDFTINGLFYDPIEDRVIDYVGGVDDIQRRIIRAIGDPYQRFAEDKLRMLRAVRFVAELQFSLDPHTAAAIRELVPQIRQVSPERILMELERLFVAPGRVEGLRLFRELGFLDVLLPELKPDTEERQSIWELNLRVLGALTDPDFPVAFAAVARKLVTPAELPPICKRLRMSNQVTAKIIWLIEHENDLDCAHLRPWWEVQPILISPWVHDLLKLAETCAVQEGKNDLASFHWCRERLQWPPEKLNPPFLIKGDDLHALGLPPGPIYRQILQEVRRAQLDGVIQSREAAIEWIQRKLKSMNGTGERK